VAPRFVDAAQIVVEVVVSRAGTWWCQGGGGAVVGATLGVAPMPRPGDRLVCGRLDAPCTPAANHREYGQRRSTSADLHERSRSHTNSLAAVISQLVASPRPVQQLVRLANGSTRTPDRKTVERLSSPTSKPAA
jgi:hypothetical protein